MKNKKIRWKVKLGILPQSVLLTHYKHKRSRTAYSYLNTKKEGLQGPHTTAHIATKAFIDKMRSSNVNLANKIINTKLAPRPKVVRKMLEDGFNAAGRTWTPAARKKKGKFLANYQFYYLQAKQGNSAAAAKLLELRPAQTYKWGKGLASKQEMAGKGERYSHADGDFKKLAKMKKGNALPKGLKLVDTMGLLGKEKQWVEDGARQMASLYEDPTATLSDAEEYGALSDSEGELD